MGWWCKKETREQSGGTLRAAGVTGAGRGRGSRWVKGISGGTAKPLLPPGGIWAWLSSRALLGAGQALGKPAAPALVQAGKVRTQVGGAQRGGQARAVRPQLPGASWEWTRRDRAGPWKVEPRWRAEHLLEGGSADAQGPPGKPKLLRDQRLLTG